MQSHVEHACMPESGAVSIANRRVPILLFTTIAKIAVFAIDHHNTASAAKSSVVRSTSLVLMLSMLVPMQDEVLQNVLFHQHTKFARCVTVASLMHAWSKIAYWAQKHTRMPSNLAATKARPGSLVASAKV